MKHSEGLNYKNNEKGRTLLHEQHFYPTVTFRVTGST